MGAGGGGVEGANLKVGKKRGPLSLYLFRGYKQDEIREGGQAEQYRVQA
jgi:hypothetical protein